MFFIIGKYHKMCFYIYIFLGTIKGKENKKIQCLFCKLLKKNKKPARTEHKFV